MEILLRTDERMAQLLREALDAEHIHVEDESWKHRNHAGARESGGGHFVVTIVSPRFENTTPVARHRMVYEALDGVMEDVHALSIQALTPAQWNERREL